MAQNQAPITQESTASSTSGSNTLYDPAGIGASEWNDETIWVSGNQFMAPRTAAALEPAQVPQPVVVAADESLATLGGHVWQDLNADELQDEGEAGIAGATVELVRDLDGNGQISADEIVATTLTDADGAYSFGNLLPGDGYQLRFATPTGFDASFSNQLFEPVTLQAGDNIDNNDIGFFEFATIGNRVWNDANANGLQDAGESGRSGVRVELYTAFRGSVGEGGGSLGNGGIVPGDLVATQLTDANGNYSFDSVIPGEYLLKFVAPDGTVLSTSNVGVDDGADSDADKTTGLTGVYLVASGDIDTSADAGVVSLEPPVAIVGGQVWHDLNADELLDAAEAGIAGATVELVRDLDGNGEIGDGEVVATTLTDADGNYRFDNLSAGEAFQVRFLTPEGYDATFSNPLSEAIVLEPGQDADVGIGFFKFASLGDRVWNDANANGLQDTGETGRAGVSVELYTAIRGSIGGASDTGAAVESEFVAPGDLVATQQTDANGNYAFQDLAPGEYIVRFLAPDGTVLSTSNVGIDDSADSDAQGPSGFTGVYKVASDEHNDSVDAGLSPEATTPVADSAIVCEDRSVTFNVLANDSGAGLKLVKVAHETASLDNTFKSNAGAISFTADGEVTYKSMTNYYGQDKLVYTLQDATGKTFTQTVDVSVEGVSDAPDTPKGAAYHPGGWEKSYADASRVTHWVHGYKLSDFGTFKDSADALQQFGTYNKDLGVASDADTAQFVRLYGLTTNAGTATILFDGKALDFSQGQTYDISVADINAGKLDLDFSKAFVTYNLKFAWVDSGTVQDPAGTCYDGSIVSATGSTNISTPIALDLNGDGQIGVTGATSSSQKDAGAELGRTVQFDIDADGKLDTIEWFDGSGDGILVDNRDGLAAAQMNGSRLFGDDGGAFANGYDKLATLDANADGSLSGDELQGLQLWVDNGDAQVQQGELRTLAELGIASISTQVSVTVDAEGRGHLQSTATREDGTELASEDVFFARAGDVAQLSDLLSTDDSALDALVGAGSVSTAASAAMAEEVGAADWAQSAEVLRKIAEALQAEAVAG